MLRSINALRDFWIHATDGDLGAVSDFFVDVRDWTVPWFIVDTGNWLPGRKVLLPTTAITRDAWDERKLYVHHTREQLKHAEPADIGPSVARQIATALGHYLYVPVVPPDLAREFDSLRAPNTPDTDPAVELERPAETEERYLHSVLDVERLHALASNGPIGRIHDLLCSDVGWAVKFVVVDDSRFAPGRLTPVSTRRIQNLNWSRNELQLDVPLEAVRAAPRVDDGTREQYARLIAHFDDSP